MILFLDMEWLPAVQKRAQTAVSKIQGSPPEFKPLYAVPLYLAMTYLITFPKNLTQGFLLGLCMYGVYDFTVLALFKDYTLQMALVDTLWGGLVIMAACYVHLKLIKMFFTNSKK